MKRKVLFAALLLHNAFAFSQQWISLGNGITDHQGYVRALAYDSVSGYLFVSGHFDTVENFRSNYNAKWTGTNWLPAGTNSIGPQGNEYASSLLCVNGTYYNGAVAGSSSGVGKFNGAYFQQWANATGDVNDLCWWNGKLVAVGDFAKINGVTCYGKALYDTTTHQWSSLAGGAAYPNCCYNWNGNLVVGGFIGQIGQVYYYGVAMYDTTGGGHWTNLGNGIGNGQAGQSGYVNTIQEYNGELYAGGQFPSTADLLKFNGTDWINPLPPGSVVYTIKSMIVFHQKLILASQNYPGILEFDGTVLDSDLASLNGGPYSFAIYNDELIAGGLFITNTQGDTLNNIARWSNLDMQHTNPVCENDCNGTATVQPIGPAPYHYQWNTPNADTTQTVNNLCPGTYQVVVTDSFGQLHYGTVIINNTDSLAAWGTHTNASCATCANGSAGISISSGTPPYQFLWSTGDTTSGISNQLPGTYTVCVTDSNGCVLCDTIAIGFVNGISPTNQNSISIKPNPATEELHFKNLPANNSIIMINLLGQTVLQQNADNQEATINISQLPTGTYVLKVITENKIVVRKVVKE